jgi:hypothetical protein
LDFRDACGPFGPTFNIAPDGPNGVWWGLNIDAVRKFHALETTNDAKKSDSETACNGTYVPVHQMPQRTRNAVLTKRVDGITSEQQGLTLR